MLSSAAMNSPKRPEAGVLIRVHNIGPISDAELVVRPLTVVVGSNNTGKTVFATIVHRVFAAVTSSNPLARPSDWRRRDMPPELEDMFRRVRAGGQRDRLPGFAEEPEEVPHRSSETLQWAAAAVLDSLKDYGLSLRAEVEYALGVEAKDLCRRTKSGKRSRGGAWIEVVNPDPLWRVVVHFDRDECEIEPPDSLKWLDGLVESVLSRQGRADIVERMFGYFPGPLPGLFDGWPHRTIHLPAGRSGIMQSYEVLASSVVRQSAAAGIRAIAVPSLPGTAADFLSLLLRLTGPGLGRARPARGSRAPRPTRLGVEKIVSDFEKDLSISVQTRANDNGRMEIVVASPEGEFSLARTSSMVSELAPILLILKAGVTLGDYIVIDEPEAHLHPALQRSIAQFMCGLASLGIQILLTTHSDFLLGEINNAIRRAAIQQKSTTEGGFVNADQVSALLFSRSEKGCFGQSLKVDPVEGIDESTFAAVMETLYEDSFTLSEEIVSAQL
jgi:AAA domain, putative AbiEii toxin, Type IV TA system